MTYEELVEKFAASRVYPSPIKMTNEMRAAYEQVEDRDKFTQDFQKKSTRELTKDEPRMNM